MRVKVSVVIPVYNAEKYIAQCIESLLDQTLKECEFIFINDGSTDTSRKIIESYKVFDSRIKLFNQYNKGVSVARNKGIELAVGDFIGFVDADDYIEKDMYERLYVAGIESDCDLVISNFVSEIEGHRVITKYPFETETPLNKNYIEDEVLLYFIKSDNLNTACNKIYKLQVIRENKAFFPEKVPLGEDGIFNIHIFSRATIIKYIDYTGYHYREVAGSATRDISKNDYFSRALEVYKLNLLQVYKEKYDKVVIQQLKSIRLINSVVSYIYIYFKPSKIVSFNYRFQYVNYMVNNKHVREALLYYNSENHMSLSRYQKFVLTMIKRKSVVGLFLATTYIRFRNKSFGGI
ncbi:glycosyltransferase [Cytobacillus sp. S13-E01]|uniref:glycosyltransferase family 2 protein n=1 Tax=Cytobacillus sp. S13-E01 TaxID=3031326 RepID=UPI0023D87ECC|nr:glycosyltransferase [Cytobacillus sp. S13-E01]MDF0727762.1 glycosyltransferase [Cytobacillus sp. S13-E01]